jgi:hypothetical protein
MIGNDTDGVGHLNAGAFAKATANAFVADVGLLEVAHGDGNVLQRAGPVADAAGLALEG